MNLGIMHDALEEQREFSAELQRRAFYNYSCSRGSPWADHSASERLIDFPLTGFSFENLLRIEELYLRPYWDGLGPPFPFGVRSPRWRARVLLLPRP